MKKIKFLTVAVLTVSMFNFTSCSEEQLTSCLKVSNAYSVFESARKKYEENPEDAKLCNALKAAANDYISEAGKCTGDSASNQVQAVREKLEKLPNCSSIVKEETAK